MRSHRWWSGMARLMVAAAGVFGLFLAVDASFLFLLILASSLLGGEIHPYAGLFLFLIVPAAVAVGAGAAWAAWRVWCSMEAPAADARVDSVVRT